VAELQPAAEYAKILSVAYEELYQGIEAVDLQGDAQRQQARLIDHYVKTEKLKITGQMSGADEAATRVLLEQDSRLNQLLSKVK
jgi:hypothetical protein